MCFKQNTSSESLHLQSRRPVWLESRWLPGDKIKGITQWAGVSTSWPWKTLWFTTGPNIFSLLVFLQTPKDDFLVQGALYVHVNVYMNDDGVLHNIPRSVVRNALILFWKRFIYIFFFILGTLCWVFDVAWAFSSCGAHCGGFTCCKAWALGAWASVVAACGLHSYNSQSLEHRLHSWGHWA